MADTREEILARNRALAEEIALLERRTEIQKILDKVGATNISRLEREASMYREQTKLLRENAVATTAVLEEAKRLASATGEYATEEEALRAILDKKQERLLELEDQEREFGELSEKRTKELKILRIQQERYNKALEEGTPLVEAMGKSVKEDLDFAEQTAQIDEARQSAADLGKEFDNTTQKILGLNNNWNQGSLTGRMLDAIGKGASLSDSFEAIGENIKETLNPTSLLAQGIIGLVHASAALTKQLDDSFHQFNQTTGGGDEYLDVISDATSENYQFGLSTQESMEGVQTLYTELAMFSSMSKDARTEMTDLVGKLKVLGVGFATSAQAADLLMQSVGYTKEEFTDFQRSLKSMSNAIKVPMGVLNEQFVEAADVIGKYGKQGEQEFKKLAVAAKATGIEMRSLLDIAAQFDTFESAAEQVGSLNAILGGAYFDTVQMVNATEEQRIDLLRRGVQASGKAFDQLGRYEKKAIAAAAGIQDINEANKLFATSTAAYAELQSLAEDASMGLSDLSEEAFNVLSPMQKFQAVLKKFQKPLDFLLKGLDMVATLLFKAVELLENTAKWLGFTGEGITLFVLGIMAIMFKFTGVFAFIFGLLKGIGAGIIGLVKGIPALGAAITSLTTAAGPALSGLGSAMQAFGVSALAAAKPLFVLGAAIALIGVGIGALLLGLAQVVSSFKELTGEQILGALGAIVVTLGMIGIGILALIPALTALATTAGFSALPLLAVGAAIAMIGFGIKMAVGSMAEAISEASGLFANLGTLTMDGANAMKAFAEHLDKFGDVTVTQELINYTKNLSNLMVAAKGMTPEAANASKIVMESAASLATVEANTENTELIEVIAKLAQSVSQIRPAGAPAAANGDNGSSTQGQLEVTVNIDGKQAWKGMAPYFEKQLRGY